MMVIFGHLTKEQKLVHLGIMEEHNKRIRRQTPLRNTDKSSGGRRDFSALP
jgi:hypothetical protein